MSNPAPFHILLVYPPVTSPVAPPGISAYVAGHLAGFGLSLNHYDANLDFFLNYILNPQTLADLLERIEKEKRQGRFNEFDSETAAFLDDLVANHDIWERKIAGLPRSLEMFRGEDFYQPNSCMSALKDIKDLLALGSLAFYPSRIALRRFSNPDVDSWSKVDSFTEDLRTNPFLPLCEEGLSPRIAHPRPDLLILMVSVQDQVLAALTMARFSKKQRPDLHVAILGDNMLLAGARNDGHSLLPSADMESLSKLVVRLSGITDPKAEAVPDFTELPLTDYLSPDLILPFRASADSRSAPMQPLKLLATLTSHAQHPGAKGFLNEDGPLTAPQLAKLADEIARHEFSFSLGLSCVLNEEVHPEVLAAAQRAGLKLIEWRDPTGQLKTLTKVLWDVAKAGIWNRVDISEGSAGRLINELTDFVVANPNVAHSWDKRIVPASPFGSLPEQSQEAPKAYSQTPDLPGQPFWRGLNDPAYLLLYLNRYGLEKVMRWRVRADGRSVYTLGQGLVYRFVKPQELPLGFLDEICRMVEAGGSVGTKWIKYNLERAFLIAYVMEEGVIVGNSSLKHPRQAYVERVRKQTGLDLGQYLERGYTSVRPEYRGLGIGTKLLEGLTARIGKKKLFSIISSDNVATQKIALRNKTKQVATFYSEHLGKEVGVWVPEWMLED